MEDHLKQRALIIQNLIGELEGLFSSGQVLRTDVWQALAAAKLKQVLTPHPRGEAIAQGLREEVFNPIVDTDPETGRVFELSMTIGENPNPSYESDEDRINRILEEDFIERNRRYLLDCICLLEDGDEAPLPAHIVPTVGISFIEEPEKRLILQRRWEEAYLCRRNGVVLAGLVLLVSFVEGVLGYVFDTTLSDEMKRLYGKDRDRDGNEVILAVEKWSLDRLRSVLKKEMSLQDEHHRLLRLAQLQRNYIHPMKEFKVDPLTKADFDTVWATTQKLMEQIDLYLKGQVRDH